MQTSQQNTAARGGIDAVNRRGEYKPGSWKPSHAAVRERKPMPAMRQIADNSDTLNCDRCGRGHARRQCPAYGQSCKKCGKMNYFYKQCKSTTSAREGRTVLEALDGVGNTASGWAGEFSEFE